MLLTLEWPISMTSCYVTFSTSVRFGDDPLHGILSSAVLHQRLMSNVNHQGGSNVTMWYASILVTVEQTANSYICTSCVVQVNTCRLNSISMYAAKVSATYSNASMPKVRFSGGITM